MTINFILKKHGKDGTIYKTACTWAELTELGEKGFETFSRKEYGAIKAMGLNENLCREITALRKGLGLPKQGMSAKEFISIISNHRKGQEHIFTTELRFNKLAEDIYARHTVSPEVSSQLYTLVLCGHAILPTNTTSIYFSTSGFSPLEADKNQVVIAISRKTSIHSLRQFLNDNSKQLESMFNKLYHETPSISERDLRIYEIRETTKMTFEEIADQIVQEFKLDNTNAEMNCDSARIAYKRATKRIAKLFSPRNRT